MESISKRYYSYISEQHQTGDIWKDLPTFGLLKMAHCSGIVITPACDLANSKVETVTYLPIVPLEYFFASRSFYPILKQELMQQFKSLNILQGEYHLFPPNQLPQSSSIQHVVQKVNEIPITNKNNEVLDRLKTGLRLIDQIVSKECITVKPEDVEMFLGKKGTETIKDRLIKNSNSTDLHFLPRDEESIDWSPIPKHSVVLFRYPITVPIEILDLAMDYSIVLWDNLMDSQASTFSSAIGFKGKKPLKVLSLNQEYLSDLLTRFVGLYVRLGSPDFSVDAIQRIKTEI